MTPEDRLRQALRRVEPDDLVAGVLARLESPSGAVVVPRWPAARWALAASVLVVIATGLLIQQQRSHTRTEAASRQLAYALEVTSRELQHVHQYLHPPIEETGS